MSDKVQARLQVLRMEFQAGEKQLAELDSQRAQLTETMLRISGAIQVLEELVGEGAPGEAPGANGTSASQEALPDGAVTPGT